MVVFTCGHCGESLQKPRVEKHYQFACRNAKFVTCVDCFKDFRDEEYVAHTKCVTEEERYSAKGSVTKVVKKGEAKQESWIEMIKSIILVETELPPHYIRLLNIISNYSNVPRKKVKFANYIKSSSNGQTSDEDVEYIWNVIEKHVKDKQESLKKIDSEITVEVGKVKKKKNKKSKKAGNDVNDANEEQSEDSKKRKIDDVQNDTIEKKKKKSKKSTANEDVLEKSTNGDLHEEPTNGDVHEEQLPTSGNVPEESTNGVNNNVGEIENNVDKKKKKKKQKLETSNILESNDLPGNVTGDGNKMEESSIEDIILDVLKEKDGTSVKKLEKKVFAVYSKAGKEITEKTRKKFHKKLKKMTTVNLDNNIVNLVKA